MTVIEASKQGTSVLRRTTAWVPGNQPQTVCPGEAAPDGAIVWFDIDRASASVSSVMDAVGRACSGLTEQVVDDLLDADRYPEGKSYREGEVRLASTFSVRSLPAKKHEEGTPPRDRFESPGDLLIQPVEMVAGPGWLLSCWHMQRRYRGINPVATSDPEDNSDLFEVVSQRWTDGKGKTSGDLGVLVMHELALTYAAAHRKLYDWLEEWELNLYVEAGVEREPLGQIWGSMSLLRRWIGPLNPPGLRSEIEKCWLPGATDHDEVMAVDNRVDKALGSLRDLGKVIRGAFGLMHSQLEEQGRERRERSTRFVEIIAAVFLVPTLVVGFFGANTWLPGDGDRPPGTTSAFRIMLVVLVVFTMASVTGVLLWQRSQRRRDRDAREQRRRLRESMLEMPKNELVALSSEDPVDRSFSPSS